jgi:hypothetical protein
MAYGDLSLDAPCKPNKGVEGGACNRQSCQAEPALHYNHGSLAWYCGDCARDIGGDSVNRRDWDMKWRPKCGHAMFETRHEIAAREAHEKTPDGAIEKITATIFGWPSRGREKPKSFSLERLLKAGKRRP